MALGAASLFVGSIFVGVELVMVLVGGDFANRFGPYQPPAEAVAGIDTAVRLFWIPIALPALAMWLVAEYFVRIRRMAWPAIVSAFAFSQTSLALGIYAAGAWWYIQRRDPLVATASLADSALAHPSQPQALMLIIAACVIAALASLAFWWRHRVPVSFALALATLLPLAFAPELAGLISGAGPTHLGTAGQVRFIACGLATFVIAMAWDRSDPARTTPRSDTAFWVHLLAGLLTIPAVTLLLPASLGGQAMVLLGFAALTALAVAIDRRAPLVIALPFLATALSGLVGDPAGPILTLVVLVMLLALVLRWDQARGWLLSRSGMAAA